jgi:hypothetical protein
MNFLRVLIGMRVLLSSAVLQLRSLCKPSTQSPMEAFALTIEKQIEQVRALCRAFALEQPSPKYEEITWQDRQSKPAGVSKRPRQTL